jgi:glycosyltransferase involved in cell wall biosynthesis
MVRAKDLTRDFVIKSKNLTKDNMVRAKDLTRDQIIQTKDLAKEILKENKENSKTIINSKSKIESLILPFRFLTTFFSLLITTLSLRKYNITQSSDKEAVKNINKIISNSNNIKNKVKEIYKRESLVINPPINTKKFHFKDHQNFWLSVNRLMPEKRIDMQIRAFNNLPNEQLIILGGHDNHNFRYLKQLDSLSSINTVFLKDVSEEELIKMYSLCKGFITTARDEDFGMTVVEAMASGKPVIAPNEGGYKETVINNKTGILINNINEEKIIQAIKQINQELEINPNKYKEACINQAKKFDTEVFVNKIKEIICLRIKKGYLKIISPKHKFIYFSIAKTGTSSIKKAFSEILGIKINELPKLKKLDHQRYKDYFKFAFVRNPWDRIVSCYLDKIKENDNFENDNFERGVYKPFLKIGEFKAGMSFDEFVKTISKIPDSIADSHFRSQYLAIIDNSGNLVVDFLGRFENLESDFKIVCKKIGLKFDLPHIRKSIGRKHYSEYYTNETKEIVEKRYKKDIEKFGYKFEESN